MRYDFDAPIERIGTDSLKWDVRENELPMWVADMDFAVCPEIKRALEKKLDSDVYGYQIIPPAFGRAISAWWRDRHGWEPDPDKVIFCTGVVPALTTLVKCLTNVGDNVVVLTPVYNIFFHSIENMGRHTFESALSYDGDYRIDWRDLEKKLAHPYTTMMILCNPHNPTGQVWTKEELDRIGELCHKYGVRVVSDEIHCDLTLPGVRYLPYGSTKYGKEAVVCVSASKAFNLAGLQGSAVIVEDERLFERVERALNAHEVAEPNLLAVTGTVAAFTQGAEWLDQLRTYLYENRLLVEKRLQEELPSVRVVQQKATYLMWIDVGAVTDDSVALCKHIRRTTGLWITPGAQYRGNGSTFVRVNIACPRSLVQDGVTRFVQGVSSYIRK
ncbi:MAG: pyridoxal phosphate-dependent aminotransferase [Clostridia bacterium]|nr:pyridoxal phosphate-dependent aminotransferase [Clostridia bacterium]